MIRYFSNISCLLAHSVTAVAQRLPLCKGAALAVLTLCFCSCGNLFEFEGMEEVAVSMKLSQKNVTIMSGDSIPFSVAFTPDSLKDNGVYYTTSDSSVAYFNGRVLKARAEGEVVATGVSGTYKCTDTCHVRVIEPWRVNTGIFENYMLVFADVTFRDAPADKTLDVAAFVGDELRGVAEMRSTGTGNNRKNYWRLLIWGSDADAGKTVTFRGYSHRYIGVTTCAQTLKFDLDKTEGTVSDLFKITIPGN